MNTNTSGLKIGDVLEYIRNVSTEERGEIVLEFLKSMSTLAQSAINLFEKGQDCFDTS